MKDKIKQTAGREQLGEPDRESEQLLKIEVNGNTLYADFEDNSSAEALKEKLQAGSLTIEMEDYGGFEKVVVIDGEARYCFHQATSPGIFSLQAKIKLMFSNAAISLRFLK